MRKIVSGRFKSILAAVALAVLLIAGSAMTAFGYSNGYYIKDYRVDITVNEDNTFDVEETITAYFDAGWEKHGIIRSIPTSNHIVREDGTSNTNRVIITGVEVDYHNYSIESGSGDYRIRIGDAYRTVEGDVTYVIRYNYDIGADPLKGKDEFYYNIIGPQWDTEIDSVDFSVKFPKEFDPSSLGFAVGYEGSSDYSDVYYKVEDNTVYGYYHNVLEPYSGLTMRLELPEGYFVREKPLLDKIGMGLMAIPVLGFLLSLLIYKKFGCNEKPVEPVEFYPPDDLDPLEIGYIYDCTVDDEDITALLVYLANKGYLEILDSASGYDIRLLKDAYEGESLQEEMFYNGLLERSHDGIVSDIDLEDSFYKDVRKIRKSYLTRQKRKEIIRPTGLVKTLLVLMGMAIVACSIFIGVYFGTQSIRMATVIGLGGALIIGVYMPFFYAGFKYIAQSRFVGIFVFGFATVHMAVVVGISGVIILRDAGMKLLSVPSLAGIAGAILGIAIIILGIKARRRTPYGNEIYGRIMGFRNFLELAEKPKLEELVEQDPAYFYNILPYTYVLNLSSTWISKFAGIAMEPPQWYGGSSDLDSFSYSINSTMTSLAHSMVSQPSGSGGDGGGYSSSSSSGGGFSGGGSGGGGGSSW